MTEIPNGSIKEQLRGLETRMREIERDFATHVEWGAQRNATIVAELKRNEQVRAHLMAEVDEMGKADVEIKANQRVIIGTQDSIAASVKQVAEESRQTKTRVAVIVGVAGAAVVAVQIAAKYLS